MRKKTILISLILIIAAGFVFRYYGLSWGIPQAPYWRSHFQDEAFTLGRILQMSPGDLNPHYFINPSFHYYTLFITIKAASSLGFIKHFSMPVEINDLGLPVKGMSLKDYQHMFFIGRILSVLYSTAVILLVFFIGTNLYDRKVGLIAAAFTAILPTLAFQSHFLVTDTPAVFWFVLTFFFISGKRLFKSHMLWLVLASLSLGFAVGTKYTNVIMAIPLLYYSFSLRRRAGRNVLRSIFIPDLLIIIGICAAIFFITTPHAILSFKEFMFGDRSGFGGIFGERGLLAYNNYPFNIITPFIPNTSSSLRIPLFILAFAGIIDLFIKRKFSDTLLLSVIIPFYLLLIWRASPHLRHMIAVLPFLMLAFARIIIYLFSLFRQKVFKYIIVSACSAVFVYTSLFTICYIKRFTGIDTRTACVDWLRPQLNKQATIGITTYFPWNYTPPIETLNRRFMVTGYFYDELLKARPDYFIITEYEFRAFYRARATKQKCEEFVEQLFSEEDYWIINVFQKDFSIFGIDFSPNFPNMDWNPVNPAIYIFKNRS